MHAHSEATHLLVPVLLLVYVPNCGVGVCLYGMVASEPANASGSDTTYPRGSATGFVLSRRHPAERRRLSSGWNLNHLHTDDMGPVTLSVMTR